MSKSLFKLIGRSFLNLVYPPLCLHCKNTLYDDSHLLCSICLQNLELIDPSERCPLCFSSEYHPHERLCTECRTYPPLFHGMASAFDYIGPAATLVRKLKYGDQTHLAEGCGAYLAAQFLNLNWPMPDIIVPVPLPFTRKITRGYNQSLLLAESLSLMIKRPVSEPLIRRSGDYSQAGLSRKQRLELDGSSIQLKSKQHLQDKCILIIDDVITTGSTLRKCAAALFPACPAKIYSLSFCRA